MLMPSAIAIEPGDPELSELIRSNVEAMKADGTLSRFSMTWFDLDLTKE